MKQAVSLWTGIILLRTVSNEDIFEPRNKTEASIQDREHLNQLNDCRIFKSASSPVN